MLQNTSNSKVKKIFRFVFLTFFLCIPAIFAHDSTFKILIKIPTRSRPEKFFACLDRYYSYLSGTVDCHFLISCDIDDPTMNCPAVIEKLKKYPNLSFYFAPGVSKIEAYNRDIEKHPDFDVLVVSSDDLLPNIKGYDVVIRDRMLENFPDTDGVLQFNDGNTSNNTRTNTYPIIGKKFYSRFGYAYHPFYKSVFADDEITLVSEALGKQKKFSDTLLIHVHPAVKLKEDHKKIQYHFDALYKKNDHPRMYEYDGSIYWKRKSKNFCLDAKTQSIIRLSILVLAPNQQIQKRLEQLLDSCGEQKASIEIVTEIHTQQSIGQHMASLIEKSNGEYICFVDGEQNLEKINLLAIIQQLRSYPDYIAYKETTGRISLHDILRSDMLEKYASTFTKARSKPEVDKCFEHVQEFLKKSKTF